MYSLSTIHTQLLKTMESIKVKTVVVGTVASGNIIVFSIYSVTILKTYSR
jgi:hypothetical protein